MGEWNHNIQYHGVVLRAVPAHCGRALDVGCGEGFLARRLTRQCHEVIGIDVVPPGASAPGITRIEGDFMTHPFRDESFDLITAVATLHHLPLEAALVRFRRLLKPGGVLAVIGLYRMRTIMDLAWCAAAVPVSRVLHSVHSYAEVNAPLQEPKETLREIRNACTAILPGGLFQRRLLFRYSFVWLK